MTIPVARVERPGRSLPITLDEANGRFEITADDSGDAGRGVLEFTRSGTGAGAVVSMNHTEMSRALRGQGLAEELVRAALDYARAQGWQIRPRCPFVAAFIESHPEYASLAVPAH